MILLPIRFPIWPGASIPESLLLQLSGLAHGENEMKRSILVVDDNADNRDLTKLLLECEGFEVRVAGDGSEAMLRLQDWYPDLILMDVQLPGIDGLAAAAVLAREAPRCRSLILTTFGRPGYLRRAM